MNETNKPVSIIVPVLNEEANIANLLAHLANLKAQQIIIVDGGSKDHTVELLRQSDVTVLTSPAGRAKQMNAGAAIATEAMLLFLHADTQLPNAYFSAIEQAPMWGRFDVRFDTSSPAMRVIAFFMNWRSRITGVATGDQAIFIDADAFRAIGGFPDMPLMEDVALCKRLRHVHAPHCSKLTVTTSARRWQENGIVATIIKMWCYRLAFFVGVSPAKIKQGYDDVR